MGSDKVYCFGQVMHRVQDNGILFGTILTFQCQIRQVVGKALEKETCFLNAYIDTDVGGVISDEVQPLKYLLRRTYPPESF